MAMSAQQRARRIKIILFDVDGVLNRWDHLAGAFAMSRIK